MMQISFNSKGDFEAFVQDMSEFVDVADLIFTPGSTVMRVPTWLYTRYADMFQAVGNDFGARFSHVPSD